MEGFFLIIELCRVLSVRLTYSIVMSKTFSFSYLIVTAKTCYLSPVSVSFSRLFMVCFPLSSTFRGICFPSPCRFQSTQKALPAIEERFLETNSDIWLLNVGAASRFKVYIGWASVTPFNRTISSRFLNPLLVHPTITKNLDRRLLYSIAYCPHISS